MNYWEDIAIRREGFTACRRRMPTITIQNGVLCIYQVIDTDEKWREKVRWDGKRFYDLDGAVDVLYWKRIMSEKIVKLPPAPRTGPKPKPMEDPEYA